MIKKHVVANGHRAHEVARLIVPHPVPTGSLLGRLRKILEERPDWEIVGEANDGRAAVQQAIALKPDIAILDIGMPFLNGIDATRQIVRKVPGVRVLMLSLVVTAILVVLLSSESGSFLSGLCILIMGVAQPLLKTCF